MSLAGPLRSFHVLLLFIAMTALVPAGWGQANVSGQWSGVQNLPYRPIHAHLLPTGKLLFWSYYGESQKPQIWDPATGQTVPAATISYDLFCAGHSFLPDGSLLATGGHIADYVGEPYASLYN